MRKCHWGTMGFSDGHMRIYGKVGYPLSLWMIFLVFVEQVGEGIWECCKYVLFSGGRLGGYIFVLGFFFREDG